ncbi:TonB-dependent siderophore receptor [Thalassospira marina]|uniref:TonB-dependent siderophore receptor n=1 Tax=Thalassospira marina TaxID=2048283 RepID=A0A2N3KX20_9PROT|nr:TonB-dependent siderophore receptor [Thalassospira marina]PKR55026.1 TonB-dependent siderophore receptor [Thalassospira marina]
MYRFNVGNPARSGLVAIVLAGVSTLALTTALATQPAAAQTTAPQSVNITIPEGPLETALLSLGRQAGLHILYPSALTAGKQAKSLSGTMTVQNALSQLLAGSGLAFSIGDDGSVTIFDPAENAQNGETVLDPITITASRNALQNPGFVPATSSTGMKGNASILEIPQSLSVVTREELDQRGVNNFNEAVAYSPGIHAIDYPGGQGMPRLFMRGFRSQSQRAYYRDGLRNGFNPYDSDVEPYALEQFDVLKGPSSVLYGDAMPGGLVNTRTKRPTEDPLHQVQVQYGSYDRKQTAVDFSGPVTSDDSLLYRFTGLYRNSDTQINYAPDDALYLAPSFTWQPDDDTSLTLMMNYHKVTKGGSEQSLPVVNSVYSNGTKIPDDFFIGAPGLSEWESESASFGYEFNQALSSDWDFQQNLRYTYTDLDYITAFDANNAAVNADNTISVMLQKRPRVSHSVMLDNNVSTDFETGALKHDMLMGLNYGYYRFRETRANSNTNRINIYNPNYDVGYTFNGPHSNDLDTINQVGLYAQDQIGLDNWLLTLGGRQDWVQTKTNDYYSRTIAAGLLADRHSTRNDAEFSGRAGLSYLFENGISPYVSYSTSFEPNLGTLASGSPAEPTTGEQYEVGIKYEPTSWNALFTASLYQLTEQNVTSTNPSNTATVLQTGEVRSRGLELEAKTAITPQLNLAASYTYTNAEVTKDANNQNGVNRTGLKADGVPTHSASAWLNYEFDNDLKGLSSGAGVRYVGTSYLVWNQTNGSQMNIPAYTLVDAAVSYDFSALSSDYAGISLQISGTNLLDKEYYSPGFYSNSVLAGTRRTVMATLTYNW